MLLYCYLFIILLNCFFVYIKKRSKVIQLLSVAFIFIFMVGYEPSLDLKSDYSRYLSYYENQNYTLEIESGYVLLAKFIHMLNYKFVVLCGVIFFSVIIVYFYAIKKYTNFYHMMIIYYLLTMVFVDVEGIRQCVSYAVYFLALTFLADKKNGKFVFTVIIGSLFQRSILFFLIIYVVNRFVKNKKKFARYVVAFIIGLSFFTFLNGNQIPGLKIIIYIFISTFGEAKVGYFENVTTLGFLYSWLGYFMNFLMVKMIAKTVRNHENVFSEKQISLFKEIENSVYLSSIVLPFTMLDRSFERIFKYNLMPIALMFSIILSSKKADANMRLKYTIMFIMYVVVYSQVFQIQMAVDAMFVSNTVIH